MDAHFRSVTGVPDTREAQVVSSKLDSDSLQYCIRAGLILEKDRTCEPRAGVSEGTSVSDEGKPMARSPRSR